jgi:hypothetical protein
MTNSKELSKKQPSKDLRKAIDDMVGSFQKTAISIDRVFSIGRNEGFSDMEIGDLIRKKMLAANYDPRTIRRALPRSAKHIEMIREQKAVADKESANENKNGARIQSGLESENGIVGRTYNTNAVQHDSTQASSLVAANNKESQLKENQLKENQLEENQLEENQLLHFQIPIPANDLWDFIIDYSPLLDREKMNHFCVNVSVLFNKRTEKVVSVHMETV